MNTIRRTIYTLTEANCNLVEITEYLGMSQPYVKSCMADARNNQRAKARYMGLANMRFSDLAGGMS